MQKITLGPDQPFCLDATLACGQVFRWEKEENGWWYGIVGDTAMKVRKDGSRLSFSGATAPFIRHYFALDLDLDAILASVDADPFIHAAIRKNRGLRLVRQPAWECTVSYICSTNSNIPTIKRRINAIAEKFGKTIRFGGRTFSSFPDPASIMGEGHDGLNECRLGYRQPYVFGTSCSVTDPACWEQEIRRLPYEAARKELMKLHGIGPKAADCVLLFAFQKYEAFPVDVWIRRIVQEQYLPELAGNAALTNRQYDAVRAFALDHFGEHCGWAQEYLYAAREG